MKGFKNIGHLCKTMKLDDHTEKPTQKKKKKKIKCKRFECKRPETKKIEVKQSNKALDIDLSIFFFFFFGRDGEI